MRILKWIAGLLIAVIAVLFLTIQFRWKRTFDAPTPDLKATTDSATIEHGRYLAYSAAGCAYCHLPKADWKRLDAGEQPPLSGNHVFPVPFGELRSPNLTPDATTGIGRRSDGEIARVLRHGVRPDNRAAFPFMEFQHLSDADVIALLSFLRSQPPVANAVADVKYNLMGKAFIHPQGTAELESSTRLAGNGVLTNTIGNPLETTIALSHLIFEGTLDRFPGLKICAAHGGGYLPSYAARSDAIMTTFPERCTGALKKKPTEYLRQLYFDSIVFTAEALRHLAAETGAGQIVMGTDYPYPWTKTSVDHILNTPGLSDDERIAMLGGTAAKLLGIKG